MAKGLLVSDTADKQFLLARRRPAYEVGCRPLRLVDMFAGAGGLSLGVAEACRLAGRGTSVRLAIEADQNIWPVYAANFILSQPSGPSSVEQWVDRSSGAKLSLTERRARKLVGPIDLLAGGPPCQGHSNLNNHTRRHDPKNQLYFSMVRAAEVFEPNFVFIENVPSVVRDRLGVLDRSVSALSRLGYSVIHRVISAADLGVPQRRKRHILIASRTTRLSPELLEYRTHSPVRTVRWAIGDLLQNKSSGLVGRVPTMSTENCKRANWLIKHDRFDLPNKYRPPCHRDMPDHRYKSMYGRLCWDLPAQTITTGFRSPGQGRFIHPAEPRVLTGHEAARLQFFPDWYNFEVARTGTTLAKAIGNAVPSGLVTRVIGDLIFNLTGQKQQSLANGLRLT